MKKLSCLFFVFLSILFSCSDDDGGDVNANGQVTIGNEEKLNLNHAVIEGVISAGSHYSFLLSFFDKEIDYKNLTTELLTLETHLYFNFYSPCSEAIKLGEFEYISPTEVINGVPDEGYFTVGTLTRKVGDVPELLEVNKGTVSINQKESEGALELTVSFDLELKNGKSLTGEYSGIVEMAGNGEIDEECEVGGGDNDPPLLGEDPFEITGGVIADIGNNDTHYTYMFILSSEGETDLEAEFVEGGSYVILSLHSAGTGAFKTGTFNLFTDGPFGNQNYMSVAEVIKAYNPAQPESLVAKLGSVVVERTNNEFTLTFDLTLNDGSKLTGSSKGEFPIIKVEGTPPVLNPANEFTWDGVNHEIVDLLVVDYGPESGHYGYDFFLWTKTNEEITGGNPETAVNYYLVHLVANSWGNLSFSDGTFTVEPGVLVNEQSVSGKNYISLGYTAKAGEDPNAQFYEKSNDFTSGTVAISREGVNTYTIEFEAKLDDGEAITGFYSGDFDLVEEPNPSGRFKSHKLLERFRPIK